MNFKKLLQVVKQVVIIVDVILIIILWSIIISEYTNIDANTLAIISIFLGIIAIVLAIQSGWIAKESKDRMDTILQAEIQEWIMKIENLRREYFKDLHNYLDTPIINRQPINLSQLQQTNIFTTWFQFQSIKKAVLYKEYMDDSQQLKLFRLHRTLIANVLPQWVNHMVSNESVRQLLMGITRLYENLEDTHNFHENYYEVLNEYIGSIEPEEEFLDYITRKKRELGQRGDNELFEPFQ